MQAVQWWKGSILSHRPTLEALCNITIHSRSCPESVVLFQLVKLKRGGNSQPRTLLAVPRSMRKLKIQSVIICHRRFAHLECLSLWTRNIRQDGWCSRRSGPLSCRPLKVSRAEATTFTRSCVFPGVALGLRVLDLTVEASANKWFCHCVHTFLQPMSLLCLIPPLGCHSHSWLLTSPHYIHMERIDTRNITVTFRRQGNGVYSNPYWSRYWRNYWKRNISTLDWLIVQLEAAGFTTAQVRLTAGNTWYLFSFYNFNIQ